MLLHTPVAHTTALTLEETIARLTSSPAVDGLLLMGTTGTGELTPASDYDLLLVLDGAPVSLRMVNTWIDRRLTEIYCTTVADLARVADNAASWPDRSVEGAMVRWLQSGRIVHDRAGHLAQARSAAQAVQTQPLATERERFGAWGQTNYDLAQTKRYLASADPIAQEAADWRMLYGISDVIAHYFTVRHLPWRGEKPAIRYLAANDPDFLALLRRCLAETDRHGKFAWYEELARLALAPVGRLWEAGTALVVPGPGFGAAEAPGALGNVEDAIAFWQALTAE